MPRNKASSRGVCYSSNRGRSSGGRVLWENGKRHQREKRMMERKGETTAAAVAQAETGRFVHLIVSLAARLQRSACLRVQLLLSRPSRAVIRCSSLAFTTRLLLGSVTPCLAFSRGRSCGCSARTLHFPFCAASLSLSLSLALVTFPLTFRLIPRL